MKRSLTTKHFPRFLSIAIVLILSTLAAQAQCDTDAEAALYTKFLADYKGAAEQQKTASESGKAFIAKFGECPTDAEKEVTKYIRNWLAKYEGVQIELTCTNAIDKTPADAFERCRPYLAKDPENLRAHLLLSLAGIKNAGTTDKTIRDQAVLAMRKTLELINSGKTVDQWVFGGNKEEAVSTLEFYSASLTIDSAPAEAAAAMLRLAHSSSSYSKDPNTYFYLARSLHDGEVKKQVEEYNKTCSVDRPPVDCETAYAKIEGTIDRVIDAYARAVALSSDKPEHANVVTAAKPALTSLYKQRHPNSEAGLDKFVAEVLSKPIP